LGFVEKRGDGEEGRLNLSRRLRRGGGTRSAKKVTKTLRQGKSGVHEMIAFAAEKVQ